MFTGGGEYCDDFECTDYSSLLTMHADGTNMAVLMSGTYDFDPAWRP